MPAREASLRITDAYRRRFQSTTAQAANRVGQGFDRIVRVDQIDQNFELFLPFAVGVLNEARIRQVTLADQYVSAFTSSELRRRVSPVGIDPAPFVERDQFGRPMREALAPPVYTLKLALLQGFAVPQAVEFATARMTRISSTMVAAAGRSALGQIMRVSDRVVGWTRVCQGNSCGACLALATGEILSPGDDLFEHPNCGCTAEPVIEGVPQTVERPTGQEIFDSKTEAEQDALFAGRGGAEKAQLIRDGMPLRDLVQETPLKLGGNSITEAPLSALT